MRPFEYLLVLRSIVMGLAVADIGASVHRLARVGRAVRWDPLAASAAVLVCVEIIRMWFAQ